LKRQTKNLLSHETLLSLSPFSLSVSLQTKRRIENQLEKSANQSMNFFRRNFIFKMTSFKILHFILETENCACFFVTVKLECLHLATFFRQV